MPSFTHESSARRDSIFTAILCSKVTQNINRILLLDVRVEWTNRTLYSSHDPYVLKLKFSEEKRLRNSEICIKLSAILALRAKFIGDNSPIRL